MLRRTVGTTLASVLSTSAFLLPPNTPALQPGALSIDVPPVNTKSVVFQLPCSECAFSGKQETIEDVEAEDDGLFWIQGGAKNIIVNLTISENGERLEVNGEPIYPLGLQVADMFHSPKIYVNQVASSASWEDIKSGNAKTTPLEVTGHGVSVMQEEIVSPEGDVLIPIKHTIFELEKQPVSLDEVTVQLLKTQKGELLIVHAAAAPLPLPRPDDFFGPPPEELEDMFKITPFPSENTPPGPPPPDFGKHKECKNLPASLCKFRNIVEDKIMGKKGGCHGRKGGQPHMGKLPGHIRPPHFPRPHGPPHHHGRPHHMRPHGHHGHHRHHFMRAFTRGLAAVLIPTMAGVAVGMTVSLLGLMVGRLIGFLWIKFYRGGRRGYASVALDETTADKADTEKEVILTAEENFEAPPVYEDAPAYEEAVKVQK